MSKIFMFLALVLTLCSCNGTSTMTANQNIIQEFKMTCYGVVKGVMSVMFYRCENKEVICYMNGSSVNCRWKEE